MATGAKQDLSADGQVIASIFGMSLHVSRRDGIWMEPAKTAGAASL